MAVQRQSEGAEVWYGHNLGVYTEETQACHRSEVPLLRVTCREGQGPHNNLTLGVLRMGVLQALKPHC